jgi:hypothetical protein
MLEKSKGLGRPALAVGEDPFCVSDDPSDFGLLFWSEMKLADRKGSTSEAIELCIIRNKGNYHCMSFLNHNK